MSLDLFVPFSSLVMSNKSPSSDCPSLYLLFRDIEDGWPSLVSLKLQDPGFEPNSSNSIPASCLGTQNASTAFGFTPCLNLPLLLHDWDQLCPSGFVI